jgi:23S rRNA (pseudouridine1915-N3)-methyltransferase
VKIRLVCVGKMANAHLKALAADYLGRLERLCDVEIAEVKDADDKDGAARLAKEGGRLREAAGPLSECVLWDERGEDLDSSGFARWLAEREDRGAKRCTFLIGSSHGVADDLKAAIPRKLRLSRFTLTHEWARALALEQIYRARCIQKSLPYHH